MSDKIQDNKINISVKEAKNSFESEKNQKEQIAAIAPKKIRYNYTDLKINFLKNRQN
ncbi:MAG: hypothetical protein ACFBSE_17370 [Prochloraceae cyanobacterium]